MKPIRRKKRGVRIIVFLLALLSVILFVFGGQNVIAHAYTAEEEAAIEKVENYVNDLLQNLDTEELQKYLDSLSQFKGVNVKEKLMSVSRAISPSITLHFGNPFSRSSGKRGRL